MKSGPAKGAKKPPPFGGAARKDRRHQGRKPGPKGGRAKGGHRRHPAGGRTIGGKKTGGKTAGGKTAGGTVSRGITAILDADICGGMLFAITPLYRMRIRSPGRNRRASGVFTRIVCRVSRKTPPRKGGRPLQLAEKASQSSRPCPSLQSRRGNALGVQARIQSNPFAPATCASEQTLLGL